MKRLQLWLAAGLFCCTAFGQAKPDYSGTWKLNKPKSTVDNQSIQGIAPDRVYTQTITQSKNSITLATKADVPNDLDGTYQITGKFVIEKVGNTYRYTKATWEGATLVLERSDRDSKKETAAFLLYIRESWQLSPDGTVITQFRRTAKDKKVTDQKYVLDKQ